MRSWPDPFPLHYNNNVARRAMLERDTVFTAHQDGQECPIVASYDMKTRAWSAPVRAANIGLGTDTRGNPSIRIDKNGRLHVFFGCHATTVILGHKLALSVAVATMTTMFTV